MAQYLCYSRPAKDHPSVWWPSEGWKFRSSNVDSQVMVGNIYQNGSTAGAVPEASSRWNPKYSMHPSSTPMWWWGQRGALPSQSSRRAGQQSSSCYLHHLRRTYWAAPMCQSLTSSSKDKCRNRSFLHGTIAKIKIFIRYHGETEEGPLRKERDQWRLLGGCYAKKATHELGKENRISLKSMKQYRVKRIRINFAGSSSVQKVLLHVHNIVTVLDTDIFIDNSLKGKT